MRETAYGDTNRPIEDVKERKGERAENKIRKKEKRREKKESKREGCSWPVTSSPCKPHSFGL